MKDVCLCKMRMTHKIQSIGIRDKDDKYYSAEAGGWLKTDHRLELFYYIELTWEEFKEIIFSEMRNDD